VLLSCVHSMAMQTDFWPAIETKHKHAMFFFTQMISALEPPPRTQLNAALQASGAIIGTNWQTRFFASLDAFLAMARGAPDIIQASFGADDFARDMRAWLKTIPPDELLRRQDFTTQFEPAYDAFRALPLSRARVATLHRQGETGTTVEVTTWFGGSYSGSAIQRIPDTATMPIPEDVDPGTLPVGAFRQALPIEPKWSDFSFGSAPLYDQLTAYLDETANVISVARRIAETVHETKSLSCPPVP
jgi:hypothetical protein